MATVESPFPEAVLALLCWSGRRLQNYQSYLMCVELPPSLHPVETGGGGRGGRVHSRCCPCVQLLIPRWA